MTRLEAFKMAFPEIALHPDGYPALLPCDWGGVCPNPVDTDFCESNKCIPTYWDAEVQFKFVEE